MKVLLFIKGYRQLTQYAYFSFFLRRLPVLNKICDIYIYCNNPGISPEIIKWYSMFNQKNKHLLITTSNAGHRVGGVEAVSKGYDMGLFKDYDYVIHCHPDVFLTDETYLVEILRNNISNDKVFFITKSVPHDDKFFSFDFFVFKPKLLPHNIFK